MQDSEELSLEQIRAFLKGSEEFRFQEKRRKEVCDWMTRLLRQQEYGKQGKEVRGSLRRYAAKMTGRSRAQATRLISRYLEHSKVKETAHRRHKFPSRFTQADIELPAKKIMERECRL